ncbi:hypothetical protein AKJ56_00605 [candidate division MSBL1 archaeon SCGC-AAA382N08]|uniref:DUF8166 domain-containing protein n=1 Tax=candidate division MSBL1 archaeon SCGC-AAA382N08 TaxID=1698285 RepID=A0A133VQH0_9EURY|nr:hypothetical protein AKJ56_00605 [candidate division MSBL1 archaeon SCGC-AAA382N08]
MKEIGQVVRVDSALNWLVEVFREGDIQYPPNRRDYSVGTFLKIPTEEVNLVSVVVDVVIYNPDYGVPRVKAEERQKIEELMPDLGDQVKTLIFVYYLGSIEEESPDHSFPNLTPRLHDEVIAMSDNELEKFHTRNNSLYLGYLPRFLKNENSSHLFAKMAERLGEVIEEDQMLLNKIRNNVSEENRFERIGGY